jgi:hypothetical protein
MIDWRRELQSGGRAEAAIGPDGNGFGDADGDFCATVGRNGRATSGAISAPRGSNEAMLAGGKRRSLIRPAICTSAPRAADGPQSS